MYCSFSSFRQHFDGQELGQQQQQPRHVQMNRITISPMMKDPIYKTKSAIEAIASARAVDVFPFKDYVMASFLNKNPLTLGR